MRSKLLAGLLSAALIVTNLQMPDVQVFAETAESEEMVVAEETAEPEEVALAEETVKTDPAALTGVSDDSEILADRALVAVCLSGQTGAATYKNAGTGTTGVYLSWRSFKADYAANNELTATYTLYRGDTVIAENIKTTNFVDVSGTADSVYHVVGSNDETLGLTSKNTAAWKNLYQEFTLYAPEDETMPSVTTASSEESGEDSKDAEENTNTGNTCTYSANDMSVGDLDGDGELELIVKWYPDNAKDNSQSGFTGKTFLDGYDIDFVTGTAKLLWRIDMGVNIRSGAHYTQFQVWDYDGDGKAEIAVKTADGTTSYKSTDGTANNLVEVEHVGDCNADKLPVDADPNKNAHDYRNPAGHIIEGDEYFSIFNGEDGSKAAKDVKYLPERGSVDNMANSWGANGKDKYGNRSERYLSGTAYLDGENPYAVFTRGYYNRSALTAYYLKANTNKTAENNYDYTIETKWIFDTDDAGSVYTSQGNHSLSVNDVDGDGCDEIIFGALTVDHDGTAKYTTGLEHGDALHVSDWVSWNPGLEIMSVHEHEGVEYHVEVHDAATGRILMAYYNGKDTGRGVAADVDPTAEGAEWWAAYGPDGTAASSGVYSTWSTVGNLTRLANSTPAQNFTIFWDGDLLSETLDASYDKNAKKPNKVTIGKWNYETEKTDELFASTELWSNNTTKGNVGLAADILGDWREEIISRVSGDKNKIRIYTTTIKTDYTVPCLLENRAYREGVAWQNVGYNQPANLNYLLSEGLVTAQLSTKEPKEDVAQLLFTPASDGKYGHEITAYEIYRAEGSGAYSLLDTVSPGGLATEIVEERPEDVSGEEDASEEATETVYFSADFEENTHGFTNSREYWAADTASQNAITSGKIYGVTVIGNDTEKGAHIGNLAIKKNATVSADIRMDACSSGRTASFALLGANNDEVNWLKSEKQILTITASATSSTKWDTITLNGTPITSTAKASGTNQSNDGKCETTGWMHLEAAIDFDTQTIDVKLTRKAGGAVIYQGKVDFINKNASNALNCIYMAAGRGSGGVYVDNISIVGTPEETLHVGTGPKAEFYYVYEDRTVAKDKVYNYKVAAVVDGKTSFLSRPLEVTTILDDYIVKCDDIRLEVELGEALDVSGIETVRVTRLSGKKEDLAIHWLDTTVDTTKTGMTKVGYTLDGEDGIWYATVSIVYPAIRKFDFGITPAGNTVDGWTEIAVNPKDGKLTNTELGIAYSSEKGYGFLDGNASFAGRNDKYSIEGIGPLPKAVYEDYAMPDNNTFAVDLDNGEYAVVFAAGSGVDGTNRLRATMENNVSVSVDSTLNMYNTATYRVNVTDSQLNIKFTGSNGRVNAIIIRKITTEATGPIAVSGVALSKETLTFETAKAQTIYGTVVPVNANSKDLEWSSNDESVATITVAENGGVVVTPHKNGTATITAALKGDSTKTKTCTVTVNNPDWADKIPDSSDTSETGESETGSDTSETKGSETGGSEGSETNGSDTSETKGSETGGSEGSETNGSDTSETNGSEAGGTESSEANESETDGTENSEANGSEAGGTESSETGGSEAGGTESSETDGSEKPTPVGGSVTPKDKDTGTYKVKEMGKSVEYTGPADKSQEQVVIPDTIEGTDGIKYDVTSIAAGAFQNNETITEVTIGNKVTEIPAKAFFGCKNLKKVKIGSGILKIGTSAFANCKKLSKLTMGKNVRTIGTSAFANCIKLKSVVIPDKATSIGKKAFYKNTSLTTVSIGKKVKTIGNQAFFGCKKLKTITIKSTALNKVGKKAFYGIVKKAKIKLPAKKALKTKYKKMINRSGVGKVTYK